MLKKIGFAVGVVVALASAYLFVPPPHRASAQFSAQGTWGGHAGGTANAVTVNIANVGSINNIVGVTINFIPSATNTGPVTVAVGGMAPAPLLRPSSIGFVALSGQELLANSSMISMVYNASNFLMTGAIDMTPIGHSIEIRGSVAPVGYLIEDGSCVSQTTYAPLFSVIGTTYGSCSGGLFAVPDSRGTMFAAMDNQGSNGAANRITTAGSACNAVSPILCGSQTQTLTALQIPAITSANTASIGFVASSTASLFAIGGGAIVNFATTVGGGASAFQPGTLSLGDVNSTGTIGVGSVSVTSNNTGGLAHTILNPILLGIRAIKY